MACRRGGHGGFPAGRMMAGAGFAQPAVGSLPAHLSPGEASPVYNSPKRLSDLLQLSDGYNATIVTSRPQCRKLSVRSPQRVLRNMLDYAPVGLVGMGYDVGPRRAAHAWSSPRVVDSSTLAAMVAALRQPPENVAFQPLKLPSSRFEPERVSGYCAS